MNRYFFRDFILQEKTEDMYPVISNRKYMSEDVTKSNIKNQKSTVLLFIVLLFFASSCHLSKSSEKLQLTQELLLDNTATFIDGCKYKNIEEYDKAIASFTSCIKTDPDNSAAMYQLAGIYYMQKKDKEATTLIEKAVKINPENDWYQMLHAKLLIASHKFKDAAAIYEKLADARPENIEYYYDCAEAYLYAGKYLEAIAIYDKIEARTGVTEELSMQKEKIYVELKKTDKAIEEIQKLITAFPAETSYYNYLADLFLMDNKPDKAFEVYEKIIAMDPTNANVHLSLAEYYRQKGQKDKSFDELKLAFSNINLDIDTKIKILMSYYIITQTSPELKDQAYTLIELLIKAHPLEAKAYSMYADFLYRDRKIKEAKEQYVKVIAIDSSKYDVWENLFLIESELNDNAALEKDSKRAIAIFPEQAGVYLFNGVANFYLKKYDDAISALKKGVELVVYDDALFRQFYTYLGDAYYANKDNDNAFSYFEKVLKTDPQNVYILNNYSYYLSLLGKDLDKAETMAKKAVDLSDTTSSYLDTYGWVLYKREKYSEAETWIKKALDNGGASNDIILEHYGDIQYKLGNTEKALEYWKKALEKGKGTEFLNKKILDRKLYE